MLENGQIKEIARSQLKGNWGAPVLFELAYFAILFIPSVIPYIGDVASIVIQGPLMLGGTTFYLNFKRRTDPRLENLFSGFRENFVSAFLLYLLTTIFILLWALLLIVPGIIAGLRYSMSFFILTDNPDIGAMNAIRKSQELMEGHKMKLFKLLFSFLGWAVLCIFTVGIGFLWLAPYVMLSLTIFYEDLRGDSNADKEPYDRSVAAAGA